MFRWNVKGFESSNKNKHIRHTYKNRIIDRVATNNREKETESMKRKQNKRGQTDGIKQSHICNSQ